MTARPRSLSPGFTLLELMISVALVLVLMLAITKIFSITSTTIGASQGFAAATRDARAAQAVFAHDIGSLAPDSPWILIRYNTPKAAFRNADDEKNDKDYNITLGQTARDNEKLTVDLNDNGVEGDPGVPGEIIAPYTVNNRNHRQDQFSFCARDRFYRQTGNKAQNTLVSSIISPEAWITYEHLVLPFTNGQFYLGGATSGSKTNPGDGTALNNPLNYYASQWVLGRTAMVMVLPTNAPSATPATEYIQDLAGNNQEFIKRGSSWTGADANMAPLSDGSTAADATGMAFSPAVQLQDSRYDLVGIDITNAIDRIKRELSTEQDSVTKAYLNVQPWFDRMLTIRHQVNPLAIKPINAATASQQVPIFLPACSQFIVEFAGDFVTQNTYGGLDDSLGIKTNFGLQPDGQIDFRYNPATGTREIQWYGLPRSVSGSQTISCANGDVMLLSDFVSYISGAGFINASGAAAPKVSPYTTFADLQNTAAFGSSDFATFEHDPSGGTALSSYNNTQGRTLKTSYTAAGETLATYYCAWDPSTIRKPGATKITRPRPSMIRITLVIDRPELNGRTTDGQTFEYVFNLP